MLLAGCCGAVVLWRCGLLLRHTHHQQQETYAEEFSAPAWLQRSTATQPCSHVSSCQPGQWRCQRYFAKDGLVSRLNRFLDSFYWGLFRMWENFRETCLTALLGGWLAGCGWLLDGWALSQTGRAALLQEITNKRPNTTQSDNGCDGSLLRSVSNTEATRHSVPLWLPAKQSSFRSRKILFITIHAHNLHIILFHKTNSTATEKKFVSVILKIIIIFFHTCV